MEYIKKLLSWWSKHALIRQQYKNIATLTILENYLTNEVLKGNTMKKGQLIDIQNKLNEAQRFLKFLTYK